MRVRGREVRKAFPDCDRCITADATVVVTLMDGEMFEVCDACVIPLIKEVASTSNPVYELVLIEVPAQEGQRAS